MKTSHLLHITAALVLFLIAPSLQVLAADGDWGVTLDAEGTARVEEDDWDDIDTTLAFTSALWGRLYFADPQRPAANTFELAAQGSYTYTDERAYLFDVDLLRITGRYPDLIGSSSLLEASAGRFRFRDTSGRVVSHLADGGRLRLRFPDFNLRLDAAYTGLQLNPNSDFRMSQSDIVEIDDDDEFFGPKRVFGIAEFAHVTLLEPHTLRIGVAGQYDLRDADDDEFTVHSGYYTAALGGPLVGDLYYDIDATLMQAVVDNGSSENLLGLVAGARLRYFREDILGSRASMSGVYASGDGNGLDPFIPLSVTSLGTVFSAELQDIIYSELAYSLRPFSGMNARALQNVQTGINIRSFFQATEAEDAANPADGRWYGNEITLDIAARIFSDLGLGISAGVFLPVTDSDLGVLGSDADPRYFGKIEVSTAF